MSPVSTCQSRSACLLAFAGVLLLGGPTEAASVRFELPEYTVALGETLDLRVLIEYGDGEPDDLFSYGVRVNLLDQAAANLRSLDLPSPLNFDGVNGAPASINLNPLVLGVKGTINAFASPQVPYSESLLATYQMQFVEVGNVTLKLEAYNTLGPTEQLFVSGDGQVLDDFIVFGETEVTVIPEPAAITSGLLGFLLAIGRRRRA